MGNEVEVISRKQHDEEIQRLKCKFKPNNLFNVPFESSLEFFKWYCVFIRPFIPMSDREREVVANLLNQRYELSKEFNNEAVLDTLLMTDEVRRKVLKECKISLQHFYVIMSTLRKKGIFKENKLIPEVIPNLKADNDGVFKLMILFKNEAPSNDV